MTTYIQSQHSYVTSLWPSVLDNLPHDLLQLSGGQWNQGMVNLQDRCLTFHPLQDPLLLEWMFEGGGESALEGIAMATVSLWESCRGVIEDTPHFTTPIPLFSPCQ